MRLRGGLFLSASIRQVCYILKTGLTELHIYIIVLIE